MYTYTGSGSAFWFAPCLPPGSLDHARPTSICECATHTCPHAWTIPTDCGTMMPYQGLVHCIAFCVFGVRFVLAACLALASPDTFSFVLEVEVHAYTHSLYLYIYIYMYIYIYIYIYLQATGLPRGVSGLEGFALGMLDWKVLGIAAVI